MPCTADEFYKILVGHPVLPVKISVVTPSMFFQCLYLHNVKP